MDIKNIGKTIAEQRKKHNMSQKDLADKLNVSNKTISKWECGNGIPDIESLDKLARAFNITLDELLNPPLEITQPENVETPTESAPVSTTPTTKNKPKKLLLSLIISCSLVFATAASLLCYFFIPRTPEIVSTDKFYVNEQTATVYCTVDNAIEQFSFSDCIEVPMTNKWNVYYDLNGLQVINSQTVNLQVGDNTFYIIVENSAGKKKTYQVIVRRKPLYVVTFNTNGGETIVNEIVMEDNFATYQEPVREGYIFNSWDFDFTQPITQDTTINATWIAKNLTINYYANNGTETTSTQAVTYDDTVSLKNENEFSKEGYTLSGWNTKADGSGTQYSVNQTFNNFQVSEVDFDLYAQWTVNQYTVTATKNLQNAGTVNGTGSFDYGTVQTLSAITNTGYTWDGWYTKDNTLVTGAQTLTVTIGDEGQEYVARWTANKYNVSLNVNGGNAISEATKELVFGDSYILPVPTRTEAVFLGWFDIDNNKYTNDQGVSVENWGVANTVTLYAHYKINEYQVSLNENIDVGGAVIGAGLKEYDSNVTITAQPKAGYSFIGWYNGTDLVSSLAEYSFTMPNTPISYTAHWEANDYTVTMDVDGGVSLADNKKTITFDDSYSLPVTSKTGYTFLGWCDEDGTQYTNAQGQSLFNWNVAGDTLLIADYKINQYQMTVNKNIDKAGSVTGFGLKDYNSTVVLTATTNDGYSFTGWYSGNSPISKLAVYSFEMPHYELSYTAKWQANDYTVTMDVNGGKELADNSKTVTYDSSYTLAIPEKDGYNFAGWYTGNYGTGTQLTDSLGNSVAVWNIADHTTVYAKWNVITYSLTFHLNGGTVSGENATTYTIEDLDIKVNNPVKAGYVFDGWIETGTTEPINSLTISAGTFGNRTFGAKWRRNSSFVAISSVSEFKNIANNLNGYYYLTADIDFEGMEIASFGSEEVAFTGVLDGNGHKLLNLKTTKGVFANLKGTVCNLYLDNITNSADFTKTTIYSVGAIAYQNSGLVQECVVNSALIGTRVGGIVYSNSGTIKNCRVIGAVSGNGNYPNDTWAAGVCIENSGNISTVYVAATIKASAKYNFAVAAGIARYHTGIIENCLAIGDVTAAAGIPLDTIVTSACAGRIITDNQGQLLNSYWLNSQKISSSEYNSAGKQVTGDYNITGTQLLTIDLDIIKWGAYRDTNDVVSNPNNIWILVQDGYPKLYWEA